MTQPNREDSTHQNELMTRIRNEMGKALVGMDEVVEEVLIALLAGGHVLLEGVPGIGKTLLVRTLAATLDLEFRRIQLTPDLMPADITGTNVIVETEKGKSFSFQPGPLFGHLILADEINRATPKTQSALLESMAESQVTVAGETRPLPKPFFVLATQNPIEMEGTYPLPEAELDRFLFKTRVPVPNREELVEIVTRQAGRPLDAPEKIVPRTQVLELLERVGEIVVPPAVLEYAVDLVQNLTPSAPSGPATSPRKEGISRHLRYGPGPRGALALVLGGKARAFLKGVPDVGFDDVARLARPSLRHRVLLSFEAEAEGLDPDAIIEEALRTTDRAPKSVTRWESRLTSTSKGDPPGEK